MPIVVHDLLVEFFLIDSLILVYDIVEYFRGHVLGRGHGELRNITELEGGAIIYQLNLSDGAAGSLSLHLQQDVFGLEVGVDHLAFAQKRQCTAYLKDQRREKTRLDGHRLVKRLVMDLHRPIITL